MNLKKATETVNEIIQHKQDPDKIIFTKQWDEFGRLKGWMVVCYWGEANLITLDMTKHYTRIIGDLKEVPDYKKGKHQRV